MCFCVCVIVLKNDVAIYGFLLSFFLFPNGSYPKVWFLMMIFIFVWMISFFKFTYSIFFSLFSIQILTITLSYFLNKCVFVVAVFMCLSMCISCRLKYSVFVARLEKFLINRCRFCPFHSLNTKRRYTPFVFCGIFSILAQVRPSLNFDSFTFSTLQCFA